MVAVEVKFDKGGLQARQAVVRPHVRCAGVGVLPIIPHNSYNHIGIFGA